MNDPIIINYQKSLLELCERNVMRYAIGDMKFTKDIQKQIEYVLEKSNKETVELMKDIFKYKGMIEE